MANAEGIPQRNEESIDTAASPASQREKIFISILLAVFTALTAILCGWTIRQVSFSSQVHVDWKKPTGVSLSPGPSAFRYDDEKGKLLWSYGSINDDTKKTLLQLIDRAAGKEIVDSFNQAIAELTYKSNETTVSSLLWLLVLGGVGGVVGVLVRSIANFVAVACVKNILDVQRWWPWYVMRPFLGFLLGALVVVLVKSDMLDLAKAHPDNNLWWLSLSMLAGFGSTDFLVRLTLLSRASFGISGKARDEEQ